MHPYSSSLRRLIASIALAVAAMSRSADAGPPHGGADAAWQFQIAPYVWAAGIQGSVATLPSLPTVDVDEGFDDTIRNPDLAFMLLGEARRGRWGLWADLVYLSLSPDASTPGRLFGDVDMDSTTVFGTAAVTYRPFETDGATLDFGAGARLWHVETELEFGAGSLPAVRSEETKSWADPILLAHGRAALGSGFYLFGYGDIGGFSAASDLTWQIIGLVGYRFADWIEGAAGYRYLSVDFKDDGFVWNVDLSGPVLGVTFRF